MREKTHNALFFRRFTNLAWSEGPFLVDLIAVCEGAHFVFHEIADRIIIKLDLNLFNFPCVDADLADLESSELQCQTELARSCQLDKREARRLINGVLEGFLALFY